jgi:hypothetical protein
MLHICVYISIYEYIYYTYLYKRCSYFFFYFRLSHQALEGDHASPSYTLTDPSPNNTDSHLTDSTTSNEDNNDVCTEISISTEGNDKDLTDESISPSFKFQETEKAAVVAAPIDTTSIPLTNTGALSNGI